MSLNDKTAALAAENYPDAEDRLEQFVLSDKTIARPGSRLSPSDRWKDFVDFSDREDFVVHSIYRRPEGGAVIYLEDFDHEVVSAKAGYGHEFFVGATDPKSFNDFAVGETVKVVANTSGHDFAIGATVTLISAVPESSTPHFQALDEGGHTWFVAPHEIEKIEDPTPSRPTIDFSLDRHATARDYAERSNSRTLAPATRAVLNAVAAGEVVDALDLMRATTKVLSLAATRAGQSMARREYTKMGRHLAYIADAVIENHVEGLPTYETGERSRLVETLKGERAALSNEVDRLAAENERLALALADTATPLAEAREEIDSLTASLESAKLREDSTIDNLVTTNGAWRKAEANAARLKRVLDYATGLLDDEGRARLDGFIDGIGA